MIFEGRRRVLKTRNGNVDCVKNPFGVSPETLCIGNRILINGDESGRVFGERRHAGRYVVAELLESRNNGMILCDIVRKEHHNAQSH